jgi:hypothetical protein
VTWPLPDRAETVTIDWQDAAMPSPLSSADFDGLHDFIRVGVAGGYAPIDEVVDDACALLADAGVDAAAVREAARTVAEQIVAAHREEQSGWTEPTDNDRLDAAFADLESAGILTRQHFACCDTCGAREIRDELDQAEKAGRPARGFTFFHRQDTEHAVDGEDLYLSFGSADREHDASVAIGHEVVEALSRHGLAPAWNGKRVHRIALPIQWRRRR